MKPLYRIVLSGIALLVILTGWWVWSLQFKARELVSLPHGIQDFAVSSQGVVAVTGGSSALLEEQGLTLIDNNGAVSQIKPSSANGTIEGVNFSPDGRKLVGNTYGGLWIAEIEQSKIIGQTSTPPQATGDYNFWDLRDISRPALFREGLIWCIEHVSEHSSTLVASRWKTSNAGFVDRKYIRLSPPASYQRAQLVLSPNGAKAAILWRRIPPKNGVAKYGVKQGFIEIWDIGQGKKLCELEEIEPKGLGLFAFSSDAKYLAASDSFGAGYIWNTQTGELIQSLSGLRHKVRNQLNSYTASYYGVLHYPPINLAFTADNRTIIAALNDGYILAYNLESGLPVKILARRNRPLSRLVVSPDNRKLYFVEEEKPGDWERNKRQTLYSLPLPEFSEAS